MIPKGIAAAASDFSQFEAGLGANTDQSCSRGIEKWKLVEVCTIEQPTSRCTRQPDPSELRKRSNTCARSMGGYCDGVFPMQNDGGEDR
jgi:hypothetical protein